MNSPTAQLLFVDDDPNVLETLERILSQHSQPWKAHFCLSADEALAVADVYDALRSERPYKPAFPEEKVVAIIQEESGRHFDPTIVEAFAQHLDDIHAVNTQFKDAEAPTRAEV